MKLYKIYTIFLLAIGLTLSVSAQTREITINEKDTPIKEVLMHIQQLSGYRILFNDEIVPENLKITINVSDASVKEVLEIIMKDTELVHVFRSDELIIVTNKKYINKTAEITGRVTNENGEPVEFANVTLYSKSDTLHLKQGSITNGQGEYKLLNLLPGEYTIKVSFIGYIPVSENITIGGEPNQLINRHFKLQTDSRQLQELIVEGERPALKAIEGKLVYYMPTLLKNKPITNAYDALKEIPGVMEKDEILYLIGTSGSTVLINGQKTNMTTEQMMYLLRTIPLSRVQDVEIMYSAPPQYNIRGAAINVILKQEPDESQINTWQGEAAAEFKQRTFASGNARVNLLYLGEKTTVDFLYNYGNNRGKSLEKMTAEHKLNDSIYHISEENGGSSKSHSHNFRFALGQKLSNKDNFDISYTGNYISGVNVRTADSKINNNEIATTMDASGPSHLHNVKGNYNFHFGLKLGAEHTYFRDESAYTLESSLRNNSNLIDKIESESQQQINRSFFYANQSHQLKNSWTLNYGGNFSLANTHNTSTSERNDSAYTSATFDNRQKETIWNVFAGFGKSFSDKLSMQVSLAAEHYSANETSGGKTNELWNDWAFFPTLNASYTLSPNHIFQFALSSDKAYPAYWSLNPSIYHFSSYGIVYGNPHLKPMRIYDVGLTYIYKQKYVIRPYLNHIEDYYTQLPFQSPDKLQQEFMQQNFDFKQQIGLMGVIPFDIGKRISSRLILNGVYWREKDDEFFSLSFDRETFFGIAQLNTDIDISSKPNLKLNVSGYYTTPTAIQGIFDLGASGSLSTGLTWTFDKNRAKLMLKADDIFATQIPFASIDFKGQKNTLDAFQDTRSLTLSFVYRFGGFKEKEREEVDTSRFGTN